MKKPQPLYRQIAIGVLLAFGIAYFALAGITGITSFFAHPSTMKVSTQGGELSTEQKAELDSLLLNDSSSVPLRALLQPNKKVQE